MAPLVDAVRATGLLEPVLVATGQHPMPVVQALDAFGLAPDGVLAAVEQVLADHPDLRCVLPAHANPAVRAQVDRVLGAPPGSGDPRDRGPASEHRGRRWCGTHGRPHAGVAADAAAVGRRWVIEADRVVSTVPLPQLTALADPALAARLPRSELRYQGVVNAVFFLRRPLDGHYWSAVPHSGTEFDGVIEMSALTGPETYGGRHLAYVMHYADRTSALFTEDTASIRACWTDQLIGLYRDLPLTPADIEHVEVFTAPFVEPVYPLGYAARKPPAEVPGTRVVLATTAQIYPNVTSWNSSVGLANDVVDRLLEQIRDHPVRAGDPRSVQITG